MTAEELLRPRYKVIASYPFNDYFMLNSIIVCAEMDDRSHLSLQEHYAIVPPLSHAGGKLSITMHVSVFDQYPHLFKKLEWWEERKPEDMPEYVKFVDKVWKVEKWIDDGEGKNYALLTKSHFKNSDWYPETWNMKPATKEQYESFINSNS